MKSVSPAVLRKRREIGQTLRSLRTNRDLTVTAVANAAGIERTRLSRIEAGRMPVTTDVVKRLLDAIDVPEAVASNLLDFVASSGVNSNDGFESFDGPVLNQTEIWKGERTASEVRVMAGHAMPALLQTEAYARRCMEILDEFQKSTVGARWSNEENLLLRMRRQAEIYNSTKQFWFLIHEAAFRNGYVDGLAMSHQVARLIHAASLPNVNVRITPFDRKSLVEPGFSYCVADQVTFLETPAGVLRITQPEVTLLYRNHFQYILDMALDQEETVAWLQSFEAANTSIKAS